MDKLLALFKSRRFWVALAGVAVVVAEPFGLSADSVNEIVMLLMAWIVGDSVSKTV